MTLGSRLALTALLAGSLAPRPAAACDNGTVMVTDQPGIRSELARAETAIELGRYWWAGQILDDVTKYVRNKNLRQHRQRLQVMVDVHSSSARDVEEGISGAEALLKGRPGDPYLLTRLAEGLSARRDYLVRNRARAREILEGLARKDLIPDAAGYLALARLRAATDPAGSKVALGHCQKRSRKPALCVLPGAPRTAARPTLARR